jgi:hypothetical protein
VTITPVSEGVRSYALDPKNTEALWKKSEEMVGECSDSSLDERPEEISSTPKKALATQDQ